MSGHTPSTDEVREGFAASQTGVASRLQIHREDFDRWLESVLAEERERIARALRAEIWPIADERTAVDRALETAAQIAQEGA